MTNLSGATFGSPAADREAKSAEPHRERPAGAAAPLWLTMATRGEASQTLGSDEYAEELEGVEGRVQESAQKRALFRDKTREIAGAMEGGSVGGDKTGAIAESDDLLAMYMYVSDAQP